MRPQLDRRIQFQRHAFCTGSARALALVCTPLMMSCCPFGIWHLQISVTDYEDAGWGNPPPAFQVGDTVQFLAAEGYFEASCRTPAPPSEVAPDEYEWRTSGPVAEIVGNGLVAMRGLGEFQLAASTSHVEDVVTRRIVGRVAAVRLTPDSVVLNVGDAVSFLVEALGVDGNVIADVNRSNGLLRLDGSPSSWSNPIAGNQADSDGVRFLWRAYRPGTVTLQARMAVYGTEEIVATGSIEVKTTGATAFR